MNMGDGRAVPALTSEDLGKLSEAALIVVDFWAPWCGPCKRLAPIYEEVAGQAASDYGGRVRFYKVNVDEESAVAQRYGITSIPAVIGFSRGKPLERYSGRTKEELSRWVEKLAQRLNFT